MPKIFISAGEPSGDIHAAKLMLAIQRLNPDVEFVGIGGSEMEKAGLKSIIPISEISVVGFWEVAKKYTLFMQLQKQCEAILRSGEIDVFVPIDYPGFNMRLAAAAKSQKIPVVYYIAPQLWAWGKNRTRKIAKNTDKLLAVFPFEEEFFRKEGINAKFVGHPLLDIPEFQGEFLKFDDRNNSIALFPGSRDQEVHKHIDLLLDTAKILHSELPNYDILIAKSQNISESFFADKIKDKKYINVSNTPRQLMLNSKVGIIKSGTSNLEACLAGLPFSMYYKTSFFTYFMGKRIINIDYLSIINILSGKQVINEYIQDDATPAKLADATLRLLNEPKAYSDLQEEFVKLKALLGNSGASENAAREIIEIL